MTDGRKAMNIHDKNGSRGGRRARPALSPEQIEANYCAALRWRDEFRAEKAAGGLKAPEPRILSPPPRRERDEGADRAAFAKGVARLEFGRAYWDERLQREAIAQTPPSAKRSHKKPG
jgi:hypothetical protein